MCAWLSTILRHTIFELTQKTETYANTWTAAMQGLTLASAVVGNLLVQQKQPLILFNFPQTPLAFLMSTQLPNLRQRKHTEFLLHTL